MANENLQVSVSNGTRDGVRVLTAKGPLTIHTVFNFQEAVRNGPAPTMIVDLTGVPYVDSAGLGAMVAAHVGAQRAMHKLAFVGMNAQVKTLTEMTHVSQLFKSYPTVKDAEAALA
jgi:anti-sigma B factor antagonist